MERFLRSIERSKAERSSKETEKNVDNRIQYVGQIAREGKLSKIKPKSRYSSSDEKKEEQRALKEEGPVPYIT